MTLPTAAEDLLAFVDAAPSPWHAAAEVCRRLDAAGFRRLHEHLGWSPGKSGDGAGGALAGHRSGDGAGGLAPGARAYVVRGGTTVIAFIVGERPPWEAGAVLVGAHLDSPGFRLKPEPLHAHAGHRVLGVEPYGGALWHTWLDRDLTLAGRLAFAGGETALVRLPGAVARIPSLAIHLNRGVNAEGLKLNPQTQLTPTLGLDAPSAPALERLLVEAVASAGGPAHAPERLLGWDLCLADVQPSALGGAARELVFAPRLDDLGCSHAALSALTALAEEPPTPHLRLVALFDHEEIGSQSMTGARSQVLSAVLERLVLAQGGGAEEVHRLLARTVLVSADMAHAEHPGFSDKHDPRHAPRLGAGPVIKANANQSYATDGVGEALFEEACQSVGVATQRFVSRNDVPCGSTIGPMTAAALGVRTVDVGNPMLSMHSCRETAAVADVEPLIRALAAMLRRGEVPRSDR